MEHYVYVSDSHQNQLQRGAFRFASGSRLLAAMRQNSDAPTEVEDPRALITVSEGRDINLARASHREGAPPACHFTAAENAVDHEHTAEVRALERKHEFALEWPLQRPTRSIDSDKRRTRHRRNFPQDVARAEFYVRD